MSKFINDPLLSSIFKTEETRNMFFFKGVKTKVVFKVERTFVYCSDVLGGYVFVPKNFYSDLASHPIVTLGFAPPFESNAPSLVHDSLYSLKFYIKADGTLVEMDSENFRELADEVLREALAMVGFSWVRRWIWYHAVRLGGKGAFFGEEESPSMEWELAHLATIGIPDPVLKTISRMPDFLKRYDEAVPHNL